MSQQDLPAAPAIATDPQLRQRLRLSPWFIAILIFAGLAYLVIWPTAQMIYEWFIPQRRGGHRADQSWAEVIQMRVVEAMATLCFAAMGASLGSFLNVVVYRLPRGRSLLGPSRCPACQAAIAGRDNMPVLSWFALRGRCRHCQAPISVRYPLVEVGGAAIFLFLLFAELLSGGKNLPVRPVNLYAGFLWIVFYTQWDLIRIYGVHVLLLFLLLAAALIAYDGLRVPRRIYVLGFVVVALLAPIWPDLFPVQWTGAYVPPSAATTTTGVATLLLGAATGFTLAACAVFVPWAILRSSGVLANISDDFDLLWAMALVGATLGWQAVFSLTLSFALVWAGGTTAANAYRSLARFPPLAWFGLAAAAQLGGWRITGDLAWWPGPGKPWFVFLAAILAALLLVTLARWRTADRDQAACDGLPGMQLPPSQMSPGELPFTTSVNA